MAYTGTITSEAEIAAMAGENVDVTGDTEANRNNLIAWAEGRISAIMKYDLVTNFASLNDMIKGLLAEYGARSVAIGLINYNMAGYTSRIEAEDMLNIHLYKIREIEKLLKEEDVKDFLI